jgi:hypothetical protein
MADAGAHAPGDPAKIVAGNVIPKAEKLIAFTFAYAGRSSDTLKFVQRSDAYGSDFWVYNDYGAVGPGYGSFEKA